MFSKEHVEKEKIAIQRKTKAAGLGVLVAGMCLAT